MGFGTILLGYILTLLDTFGGGIVGCPVMAYGFYKASRANPRFSICAVLSVLLMYEPVLQVLAILKVIDTNTPFFHTAHVLSYLIKLMMLFVFYLSIIEIARHGKAAKLESGAFLRLYLNCGAYLLMVVSGFVELSGMQMLINVLFVVAAIVNILFFWDCASKITTRTQLRKDEQALRKIDEEEKKKAEKRRKRNGEDKEV